MLANLIFFWANRPSPDCSTLLNWGSICWCHIRFRKAWRVQGHSADELPFRALGGVYGSWLGFILVCLVLIAQFYTAVCESSFFFGPLAFFISVLTPLLCRADWRRPFRSQQSGRDLLPFLPRKPNTYTRLSAVQLLTSPDEQAAPVVITLYIIAFLMLRTFPKKAHEIDLDVSSFLDMDPYYS